MKVQHLYGGEQILKIPSILKLSQKPKYLNKHFIVVLLDARNIPLKQMKRQGPKLNIVSFVLPIFNCRATCYGLGDLV